MAFWSIVQCGTGYCFFSTLHKRQYRSIFSCRQGTVSLLPLVNGRFYLLSNTEQGIVSSLHSINGSIYLFSVVDRVLFFATLSKWLCGFMVNTGQVIVSSLHSINGSVELLFDKRRGSVATKLFGNGSVDILLTRICSINVSILFQ